MDEIINIVNEKNEIIRQDSLYKAHEKKLLHRSSVILLFLKDTNKVLIQRRSEDMYKLPGMLCFPGGHASINETPKQAAKRELAEEMFSKSSIDIDLEEMFTVRKSADDDHEFMSVFKGYFNGEFNPDENEVSEYFFEDLDKIMNDANPDKYTQTTRFILDRLKQNV